jgi:hypothetical protein
MRSIHNDLSVGEIVKGGNHTVFNSEGFVDDLDYWTDAISGAGSGGNEVVFGGPIEMFITPNYNIEGAFLDWSCDDNLFNPLVKIGLEKSRGSEFSRAFENDLYSFFSPINGAWGVL